MLCRIAREGSPAFFLCDIINVPNDNNDSIDI